MSNLLKKWKTEKHFRIRVCEISMIVLQCVLFLHALSLIFTQNIMRETYVALDSFTIMILLLFALILFWCSAEGKYAESVLKNRFEASVLAVFFFCYFALYVGIYFGLPEYKNLIWIAETLVYLFITLYWLLFWGYQKAVFTSRGDLKVFNAVIWTGCIFCFITILANFKTRLLFFVNDQGEVISEYSVLSILILLGWAGIYFIFVMTRKCPKGMKGTLLSYLLFPFLLGMAVVLFPDNSVLRNMYPTLACLCLLLPLYFIFFSEYSERGRQLTIQEQALTEARVGVMLSQIQPHFIYNSLTAIIGLIDIDKEMAKDSIVSFSDYLRMNLDSLKEVRMIPFRKELEHCETYLQFEQLRFDNLQVEYDLETEDFYIPVLTIQPIIENAVKHGLTVREEGGIIRISTRRSGKWIEIRVEDNGVGFIPESIENEEKTHVGLANVRSRLLHMCDGNIIVESRKGLGTRVTVKIPYQKEGEQIDESIGIG